MKSNIEQEVRTLWRNAKPHLTDDELDIYFDEIFDPAATTIIRHTDGTPIAAAQWREHKMTFVSQPISVALIDGLVIAPTLKPTQRREALQNLLAHIHPAMHARGMMYSIIIPADDKERQWLADLGYANVANRLVADTRIPDPAALDPRVTVEEPDQWTHELWIYYAQHGGQHDFELKLNEHDFFALIARHDAAGGRLLVARRHGRIVGFALVKREGKPLKSGKPSTKQFRMNIRFILASDEHVLFTIEHAALTDAPDCKQLVMTGCCPSKGFKSAEPHAMARVIDAERFLTFVAGRLPGLQLSVTIADDADIPANARTYRLRDGRCYVNTTMQESPVGVGGIPAMFLAGQPVLVPCE